MPRKSAAALNVVRVMGERFQPPPDFNEAQAREWRAIVDSLPADYFRPSDISLLSAYCVAAAFYREAAEDMARNGITYIDERGRKVVNPAHQILTSQASAMAQMSVKLRLCPSARYSEKKANTLIGESSAPRRPWETNSAPLSASEG